MKVKKILALMFVLLLVVSSTPAAYANSITATGMNGDLSYAEGAQPYVQTAENLEILIAQKREMAETILPLRYDPDGVYYTLNVPYFEQDNGYYCGPATVKQVIHYLNGSSSAQSAYAKSLGTTTAGTTMPYIADVLNSNTTKSYAYDSIGTFAQWMSKVLYGMVNSKPAVIDIDTRNVSAFPYNSDGHYVNTSGLDTTAVLGSPDKVRITDPFGPGLGNRWYYASDVYAANNAHWRQAIIW